MKMYFASVLCQAQCTYPVTCIVQGTVSVGWSPLVMVIITVDTILKLSAGEVIQDSSKRCTLKSS